MLAVKLEAAATHLEHEPNEIHLVSNSLSEHLTFDAPRQISQSTSRRRAQGSGDRLLGSRSRILSLHPSRKSRKTFLEFTLWRKDRINYVEMTINAVGVSSRLTA